MPFAPVQISDRNPIADYTRAAALLAAHTNHVVLVKLCNQFTELPGGQVLLPPACDYPPKDLLEEQIHSAIASMGGMTLDCEACPSPPISRRSQHVNGSPWQVLSRVLPAVITVYDLHAMRIDAISAQNSAMNVIPGRINPPADIVSFVPPDDLCNANQRIYLMRSVDDMIEYFYEALRSGALTNTSPSLGHIVNFAYRMVSHLGPEQVYVSPSAVLRVPTKMMLPGSADNQSPISSQVYNERRHSSFSRSSTGRLFLLRSPMSSPRRRSWIGRRGSASQSPERPSREGSFGNYFLPMPSGPTCTVGCLNSPRLPSSPRSRSGRR